jgi:hypothetical protein
MQSFVLRILLIGGRRRYSRKSCMERCDWGRGWQTVKCSLLLWCLKRCNICCKFLLLKVGRRSFSSWERFFFTLAFNSLFTFPSTTCPNALSNDYQSLARCLSSWDFPSLHHLRFLKIKFLNDILLSERTWILTFFNPQPSNLSQSLHAFSYP